jgi:D-arabinose 1-dehydrogenase-like Zn-dependent alcohol dehydrogenase
MESASNYRAVQAVSKGKLELTHKPLLDPPAGHVRIRVEACGVCHSDSATVEGVLPIEWPRVPGHEAVGRIDVVGEGASGAVRGEQVVLDRVTLGDKTVEQVPAVILSNGGQSLLGQSFLSKFSSVHIEGDKMILR